MKFLFIVQTEGRGHMSQAMVLADWLEQAQHQICTVLVGKGAKNVPSYFLDRFHTQIKFFQSPYFSYDAQSKGMALGNTIFKNLAKGISFWKSIRFVKAEIERARPDVVINFYDLIGGLAQIGFQKKYLYIVLSHHFYHTSPYHTLLKGRAVETAMLKVLNRIMALGADHVWALSYRAGNSLGKLKIMPPLVRSEIMEAQPTLSDYILAYSVNEGYAAEIKAWQLKQPELVVHYFWTGAQEKSCEEVQTNLFFHRVDQQKFTQYLIDCKGYIATAGFESVCEALYLAKPIALVPVSRQIEQSNNALDATRAGNCIVYTSFEEIDVSIFKDTNSDNSAFKNWVNSGRELFVRLFV